MQLGMVGLGRMGANWDEIMGLRRKGPVAQMDRAAVS